MPTPKLPNITAEPSRQTLLITRLTALWALNEAVLGGVLHGIRLPVTGLTVGAIAVLIICLIGHYGNRRDVLKATLVVCIIKAMLSPQTPFPAYIAVLFQGVTGFVLFYGKGLFALRCTAFAVIALLESALQKLLMLTLLFGVKFWDAVSEFISKLLKQFGIAQGPYALYIVWGYIALHVLAGVAVGVLASRLPQIIRNSIHKYPNLILKEEDGRQEALPAKKNSTKKRIKPLLAGIWLVLAMLLAQAWLQPGRAWLPVGETLGLIVRSAVIMLAWYLLVGPLLLRWFRRWLAGREGALKTEVQAVLSMMPSTLHLARRCWENATSAQGSGEIRRAMPHFLRQFLVNLFPLEDVRRPA